MSGQRFPWLVVLLAIAGAVGGTLFGRWLVGPLPGDDAAIVGSRRPDLVLPDLDGQPQTLASFDGRPFIINYWATWCPPCVAELPRLAALHARRTQDGLAVLAIAMEDDPDTVRRFLTSHQLDLPVRIEAPAADDSSVGLGNSRGVLPYSVLVGADGTIIDTAMGELRDAKLRDWAAQVR